MTKLKTKLFHLNSNPFSGLKLLSASIFMPAYFIGLSIFIILISTASPAYTQDANLKEPPLKTESDRIEINEDEPDTTPLSRSEFTVRLMHLLEQDKNRVSNFATYRDVPLSDEHYAEIEIARERGMLPETQDFTPQGFFKPQQLITRREALEMMERTLSGKQPSIETSILILEPLVDVDLIDDELKPVLAKLLYTRIIRSERLNPIEHIDQFLQEPFTEDEWQKLSERLLAIRKAPYFLLPKTEDELQALEGGIELKILPTQALFKERLGVGDDVYFTISEDHEFLPRGSSIHGKVSQKTDAEHFTIHFNQAKTPLDVYYKTDATLDLTFGTKKDSFIIPTEPLSITTKALPQSSKPVPTPNDTSLKETLPASSEPLPN